MRRLGPLSVVTGLLFCAGLVGQAHAFRARAFTGSRHLAAVTARQNAHLASQSARQARASSLTTHQQLKAMHDAPAPVASAAGSHGAAPAHNGSAPAASGAAAAPAGGPK